MDFANFLAGIHCKGLLGPFFAARISAAAHKLLMRSTNCMTPMITVILL